MSITEKRSERVHSGWFLKLWSKVDIYVFVYVKVHVRHVRDPNLSVTPKLKQLLLLMLLLMLLLLPTHPVLVLDLFVAVHHCCRSSGS